MSLLAKFSANLPPSSLHSFRRILKNVTESGQLPELVIVDHQETFTNKFYHSVLDEFDKIGFNYHNISVGANGTCKFFLVIPLQLYLTIYDYIFLFYI